MIESVTVKEVASESKEPPFSIVTVESVIESELPSA